MFEVIGLETIPVIFPETVQHAEMAESCQKMKPISAGFCKVREKCVDIWGKATSLDLIPKEGDAERLQSLLKL